MEWHAKENKREMPWKGEKDPYKVWLSEIILQQTRVEQGWNYYERFIEKYKTIEELANAKDEDVFKLWEGLGYYTRCRNLLHTARFITSNYNGKFPGTFPEIVALKGVGNYTASAIASFCFNLPHAVVDGNVLRVLARLSGNATPIDSANGKKIFSEIAAKVIDTNNAGIFNQAIMDFGATICKPAIPACSLCYLKNVCVAFKKGMVNVFPVKEKKLNKKTRWLTYFIFEVNGKKLVRKRIFKDIWQNLFEFYLVETDANPGWTFESVVAFIKDEFDKGDFEIKSIQHAKPQQLTHQHIKGYFISVNFTKVPELLKGAENQWLDDKQVKELAFPGFINQNVAI